MFGLDIMTYEDQAGCGPFLGLVKTEWRMYIDWNGHFLYRDDTHFPFLLALFIQKAVSLLAFTTCCNYVIKRGNIDDIKK